MFDSILNTHRKMKMIKVMDYFCEMVDWWKYTTAFTCSKLTIEAIEYDVKMFEVNNKDTRTTPLASFWCVYFEFEHISYLDLVFLLLVFLLTCKRPLGTLRRIQSQYHNFSAIKIAFKHKTMYWTMRFITLTLGVH